MRNPPRVLPLLVLTLVSACATVGPEAERGPPGLAVSVSDVPDVPSYPTQVTVKNGQGEVVLDGAFDGKPDSDYRLSGNPARDKLDGTLDVTTTYANGTTKTQTLTHDPGKPVKLDWDRSTGQYTATTVETPGRAANPDGPGWGVQIFVDYKGTPYSSTTMSSSGSPVRGSPDLSESIPSLGFGVRRYFDRLGNGAQPFAYAAFSEYFGSGARGADVIYHFGSVPDSGGEIQERRSFLLGAGGRFALGSNVMLDLMVGMHATQMRVSVFSDERSGGGPDNQFSSDRWLYGPTLGGGLSFPLFYLGQGSPVLGFLMYKAMMMKDVAQEGVSPFTGNTYTIRADGGVQHKVMFGLEKRF